MRIARALPLLLLAASLTAADTAPEPVEQGAVWTILANGQSVQPGVPFGLIAQLSGPGSLEGVEVGLLRALTGGPQIDCDTAETDAGGFVSVTCVASFWPIPTQVLITLVDEFDRVLPDFSVNVSPPVLVNGLNILGTDRITIARDQSFTVTLQAVENGQPIEDLRLEITRDPINVPLSCPPLVFTDSLGQAEVTCASLDTLQTDATVLVTFSNGEGLSATLTVDMLAQDRLEDGVFKVSGNDQAATEGRAFPAPLAVRTILDGRPVGGVTLRISTTDPNLIFCPEEVQSGAGGLAFIQCSAGFINGNGTALVFVESNAGIFLVDPFRLSVIDEQLSTSANFTLVSAPSITIDAGKTVEEAVTVEARNEFGDPVAGVPVYFSSNQNIVFDPALVLTGFDGRATTTADFGCPGGRGQIFIGPRPGTANIRIPVDIVTGGPELLTSAQGDGLTGAPGERLGGTALVALLTDRCFNGIGRRTVSWRVEPPEAATLENIFAMTDGRGRSSAIVQLGSRPGPFRVVARFSALETEFDLEVVAKAAGLDPVGPSRITLPRGEQTPLAVRIFSQEGFPVPGRVVSFALTDGLGELSDQTATTDAQGVAAVSYQAPTVFSTARVTATTTPDTSLSGTPGTGPRQGGFSVLFEIVTGGRRPTVGDDGFVNGASFRPGFTPGSLGSVFGGNLMEDVVGVVGATGPPFPTQLRGVNVTVNGIDAPLIALANSSGGQQINLQVPFEVQPGPATVVVSNNGTETVFENVAVNAVQPGIFEVDIVDGRYAAALHSDFRLVSPADPARPGEVILLFLTGAGATDPPVGTNQAGPTPAARMAVPPIVGLDHQGVESFGGFYAPGLATAYQINFRVPDTAASGNRELTVVVDGAGSQTVLLPVQR